MIDISLVIPTFKEEDNIVNIIYQCLAVFESMPYSYEIVVVDDNSPDETISRFNKYFSKYPSVRMIVRKNESGLSSAIYRGFYESKGTIVGVIDADLSHPPTLIKDLVFPLLSNKADMTIGSRYMKHGGVENWPFFRKLTSIGATIVPRLLLKVKDPMSGFFFVRRELIVDIAIASQGYKILMEYLFLLRKKMKSSFRVLEIPYIFRNRDYGKSKLDKHQYFLFVKDLMRLLKFYFSK